MTKRIGWAGMMIGMALSGGCAPVEAPAQVASVEALSSQETCGGIAGFACPEGQRCLIHEDYPDAMGTCVGHDESRRWNDRCSTIHCLAVACPDGYERVITPGRCCGVCVPRPGRDLPEGSCRTAADCDGLIHIMCVGSWSCEAGRCAYECDGGEPLAL